MTSFDLNKKIDDTSNIVKNVRRALNYLDGVFPSQTPELDRNTWIVDLFLLVTDLREHYVIDGRENDMKNFFISFWQKVEKARKTSTGDKDIVDFAFASSSGTTGKTRIVKRFAIMKQHFLIEYPNLVLLDPKREFDHYEKVVIFRRDKGICKSCGKPVQWKDYEADHIFPFSKGGLTRIENGQVLCGTHNSSKGAKTN